MTDDFQGDDFEKKLESVEPKNITIEPKKEQKFTQVLNESEQHIKNLEKKLEKVKNKPVQYNIENLEEQDDIEIEQTLEIPFIKDDIPENEELNAPINIQKGIAKKVYDKQEELKGNNHEHINNNYTIYDYFICCFKPKIDENSEQEEEYENFNEDSMEH